MASSLLPTGRKQKPSKHLIGRLYIESLKHLYHILVSFTLFQILENMGTYVVRTLSLSNPSEGKTATKFSNVRN